MRLLGASGTRLATTGSGARWAPFRTDRAGRRDPAGGCQGDGPSGNFFPKSYQKDRPLDNRGDPYDRIVRAVYQLRDPYRTREVRDDLHEYLRVPFGRHSACR